MTAGILVILVQLDELFLKTYLPNPLAYSTVVKSSAISFPSSPTAFSNRKTCNIVAMAMNTELSAVKRPGQILGYKRSNTVPMEVNLKDQLTASHIRSAQKAVVRRARPALEGCTGRDRSATGQHRTSRRARWQSRWRGLWSPYSRSQQVQVGIFRSAPEAETCPYRRRLR